MIKKITRDDLVRLMSSKKPFKLIDVLSHESYDQEHIKGSISLPVDEIDQTAKAMFKKSDKLVTYCASFECQASTKAAEKLLALGFKRVLDYKGGLEDYKEAGYPLEGSLHKEDTKEDSKAKESSCCCC
ncbi:MAG: rhodanese-like domain-containing protein [Candidatus Omnitrophica bacterium]|nr:rhodanese-like domain-containing protein [Candidatus Omnitrophota bacterium]HOX54177.1 rhodanese-like domain-containing protein [Candidatus Omnitrophota bacterium]